MRGLAVITCFIFAILCVGFLPENTMADGEWNVRWYDLNKLTLEYETLLGTETWPAGNFSYNWKTGVLYEKRVNYVGFIATSSLHFDGGKYKFRAYADDSISVRLDEKEILNTTKAKGWAEVEIEIPKGLHILEVRYKETCCSARVSFSFTQNRTGLEENTSSESHDFLKIVIVLLIIVAVVAAVFIFKKVFIK